MRFLPRDYDIPVGAGNYMTLEEGENRFRVLSSAIVGWKWWEVDGDENIPHRVKTKKEVPGDILASKDSRRRARHFWAFVVWNHNAQRVQILELTQVTIMRALKAVVDSWGDPEEFDIVVRREKTGPNQMDVEYTVLPIPAQRSKEVPEEAFETAAQIDLTALYRNEDPFEEVEKGTGEAVSEEAWEAVGGEIHGEEIKGRQG